MRMSHVTDKGGKKAKAKVSPKKTKKAVVPKPKTSTHPKTSVMVTAAIGSLKERHGSSLQAIKKYIAANYKIDIDKQSLYIKRYLRSAVLVGEIVQTKGTGASGSFKLPAAHKPEKKQVKKVKKSPVKPAKPAKLPKASPKKVVKKAKSQPKPKVSPSKSPKAKKIASPAKKVKSPKGKKAAPKPKRSAKKAAKKK